MCKCKYGFPCKLIEVPGRGYVSMGDRWYIEVVQDFDGKYYAHMTIEGKIVENLPEYVDYRTLMVAIENETGIRLLKRKDMIFEKRGRKKYAHVDATGGSAAWRQKVNADKNGMDCRITFKDIEKGYTPDFTRYDLILEVVR